jgi:hypothetical protein
MNGIEAIDSALTIDLASYVQISKYYCQLRPLAVMCELENIFVCSMSTQMYKYKYLTDFRLLRGLIVDVNSVLGMLHRVMWVMLPTLRRCMLPPS